MATKTFRGTLQNWTLQDGKERKYITAEMNYGKARKTLKADIYNPSSTDGEQRPKQNEQVRVLRNAIMDGSYTPDAFTASVKDGHNITYEKSQAIVEVLDTEPLALINGFQRFTALEELRAGNVPTRLIDNLPVTCMIMLDPEKRKENFVNLNKGKPVNKTHLLNLMVDSKLVLRGNVDATLVASAREIAQALQKNGDSHLNNLINLSGYGGASIPLASIASYHKSEQPKSLYGTALICRDFGKDVQWGVDRLVEAWGLLRDQCADLIEAGNVLCPPPDGKNAGAALVVGLGNLLAYRLKLLDQEESTDVDVEMFINAAREALSVGDDNTVSQMRTLLGNFAAEFLKDLAELSEEDALPIGFHDGLPIALSKMFSAKAYGREELPKEKKAKKPRKAVATPKEEEVPETTNDVETSTDDSDTVDGFDDVDEVEAESVFD